MIPINEILELLKSVSRLEAELSDLNAELELLRGGVAGSLGEIAEFSDDALSELRREAADKLREFNAVRRRAVALIETLPDAKQSRTLFLRYIRGMSFSKIADIIGVTQSSIYNYHRAALLFLEKSSILKNL